ncbi:hypothetical protein D9757_001535 [Collybiopsis confluens]|uniref:BD-FAE-like domain-containing protein n=1 Tax=Collybiopsis confluens TaxID=2823264 RepID=A0A8H5HZ55_9AGAR|nr:hypothetical protein D9757_001535 [Collybiopsis confluens]
MQKEIREEIERIGTDWSAALAGKIYNLYQRIHQADARLEGVKETLKDIKYGPHERNVLDLYIPAKNSTSSVVVFSHGGGLVSGDKSMYKNIGTYFASHGIIAVVNSYRLVPGVIYPGGGDDIQMLRDWIYQNISKPEHGGGNPEKVVLVGHSAGGLHIATNIYAAGDPTSRTSDPLSPPVAGVVYLSTPFSFNSTPDARRSMLKAYYGADEGDQLDSRAPVGLIEAIPKEKDSAVFDPKRLPTLIVVTQYDPEEIQSPVFQFVDRYRNKSPRGILPELTVVPGHNHLSTVCSIGTEDDVQGRMLREFIGRVCTSEGLPK